jgi:large subunit ribosomal protein L6
MSKIGRLPITIPSGVTLSQADKVVTVSGTKGNLTFAIPRGIKVEVVDTTATVTRNSDLPNVRALHGLVRAQLANMVTGVTTGFSKVLELVGTGYRARLAGTKLILSLGFSHEIEYSAPAGISIAVEGTNLITVTGIDRQLVGEVAAKIRSYRKPEPYKGKGIRYQGEHVRRKAGKAAKAGASA